MIHLFDHRWASFEGEDEENGIRDVTLAEKQNTNFESTPRYWIPENEGKIRIARVPTRLKSAYRKSDQVGCLKVLAEWVLGSVTGLDPAKPSRDAHAAEAHLVNILGRRALAPDVVKGSFAKWLGENAQRAVVMYRETPLTQEDLQFLAEGKEDVLKLTGLLVQRKQPRWLMGWRDICRSNDERTMISAVIPAFANSDKFLLMYPTSSPKLCAALLSNLSSLPLDFVARQKFGATSFKLFYMKQLPIFTPMQFTHKDLAFITPRVLELTYNSWSMRLWAEDLGHFGPPFTWDETRRAELRAELDAFFARKYNLSRDELRYVLDPADIEGPDYPSETFRGLKSREEARFGEYRTGRLVLEAWDRFSSNSLGERPVEIRDEAVVAHLLRDGAWARPMPAGAGDAGAMLAAILKAMTGPMPARQVRLAATFGLEPRLLLPHLDPDQAVEWQRLIGGEAAPLTGNAASFAPRVDRAWGSAVVAHRGNGRLVEDAATGTWAPGPGLDAIDTAGWPDGRAGMLMRVLPHIATDAVISAMPAEIRGWIDAAAA